MPTPISPAPGAVVSTSHPLFTWTLPSNEESWAIYISKQPETTPEGRFYDENVEDLDFFSRGETTWSPTSPLYARTYWWIVASSDRETFQLYYSAPIPFTIRAQARITSLALERYLFIENLDATVRWRANTREVVVTATISTLAGRRVWRDRERELGDVGSAQTTYFSWWKPERIRQGRRLLLTIRVRAGTAIARTSRVFRAP